MLSLLYLVVEAQQYFLTSSYMFLDEKTVLEIWLHPGLNLTIFQGTRPSSLDILNNTAQYKAVRNYHKLPSHQRLKLG